MKGKEKGYLEDNCHSQRAILPERWVIAPSAHQREHIHLPQPPLKQKTDADGGPPSAPAKSTSEKATREPADLGDKAVTPEDGGWKQPRNADGGAAAAEDSEVPARVPGARWLRCCCWSARAEPCTLARLGFHMVSVLKISQEVRVRCQLPQGIAESNKAGIWSRKSSLWRLYLSSPRVPSEAM